MRNFLLTSVAVVGLAGSTFAYNAFAAQGDAPSALDAARMQRMIDNQSLMLDAHLAGMKAGLKLTPEQEKNWPAFETAIRDAAKARMDAERERHDHMGRGDTLSPIDHLNRMSDHLQKSSAALKMIAEAGKPLFDSLDDAQKHHFGPLLRDFMPRGRRDGERLGHDGRPERMQ